MRIRERKPKKGKEEESWEVIEGECWEEEIEEGEEKDKAKKNEQISRIEAAKTWRNVEEEEEAWWVGVYVLTVGFEIWIHECCLMYNRIRVSNPTISVAETVSREGLTGQEKRNLLNNCSKLTWSTVKRKERTARKKLSLVKIATVKRRWVTRGKWVVWKDGLELQVGKWKMWRRKKRVKKDAKTTGESETTIAVFLVRGLGKWCRSLGIERGALLRTAKRRRKCLQGGELPGEMIGWTKEHYGDRVQLVMEQNDWGRRREVRIGRGCQVFVMYCLGTTMVQAFWHVVCWTLMAF